jgi:hypothetical protein
VVSDPQYFLPAWLREFGSVAGLLSLAVVVVDRLFKDRPRASITIGDYGPMVAISNPAAVEMTVTGYRIFPPAYGLARNESLNNIVRGAVGEQFSLLIKAGGSENFVLLSLSKGEVVQTDVHGRGLILLFWRKNSSLWLPQIPVWTSYHVAIIKSLR